MLEKHMPRVGDLHPQTAKWGDLYVHHVAEPFKVEPSAVRPHAVAIASQGHVGTSLDAWARAPSSDAGRRDSVRSASSSRGSRPPHHLPSPPARSNHSARQTKSKVGSGGRHTYPRHYHQLHQHQQQHHRQDQHKNHGTSVQQMDGMVSRLTQSFDLQLENLATTDTQGLEESSGVCYFEKGELLLDSLPDGG